MKKLTITPRGGFSTRHVKAPRETVPSLFEPVPKASPADRTSEPNTPPAPTTEKSSVPSPAEAPPTLLEVLRFMNTSDNHSGWLIIDEILFVATTHYKMKFNQQTLLDALRELYTQGCLAYKLNGFDQHTFQLIENQEPSLKMLLAEVDTLMGTGGTSDGI